MSRVLVLSMQLFITLSCATAVSTCTDQLYERRPSRPMACSACSSVLLTNTYVCCNAIAATQSNLHNATLIVLSEVRSKQSECHTRTLKTTQNVKPAAPSEQWAGRALAKTSLCKTMLTRSASGRILICLLTPLAVHRQYRAVSDGLLRPISG